MSFKPETQNPKELATFLSFLAEEGIRTYVEIGLYSGSTFKAVHGTLDDICDDRDHWTGFVMLGIDLPMNLEAFAQCKNTVAQLNSRNRSLVTTFWTPSTQPDTVEAVLKIVQSEPGPSLVFIDGDHSYWQSREDYLAYKDAFDFVAFNDISARTTEKNKAKHDHDVATVAHLWASLTLTDLDCILIEDPKAPNPRGIGIIRNSRGGKI